MQVELNIESRERIIHFALITCRRCLFSVAMLILAANLCLFTVCPTKHQTHLLVSHANKGQFF